MRTLAIKPGVITLVAAAALLAGCDGRDGGEPRSASPTDNGVAALAPDKVLPRATAALKTAKSYRMKGAITSDGKRMGFDLRVSGNDLGGRLSIGDANAELVLVAGQQYIRGDGKFWAQTTNAGAGQTIAQLLGDKWVKVPANNKEIVGLFGVVNVDHLLNPGDTVTKGATREIEGVKTIGLVDKATGETLYVATTGQPYPIRMEGSDPAESQITLSDFGARFDDVKAPAEAEVVDLEKLKSR